MIDVKALHAKITMSRTPVAVFIQYLKPVVFPENSEETFNALELMPHSLVGYYDRFVELEDLGDDIETWLQMNIEAPA